jgi:hypothetical protein
MHGRAHGPRPRYVYHADFDSFLLQLHTTSPIYFLYTGLPPSNDDRFDKKKNCRNDDGNNSGTNNSGKGQQGLPLLYILKKQ